MAQSKFHKIELLLILVRKKTRMKSCKFLWQNRRMIHPKDNRRGASHASFFPYSADIVSCD
jgi:hypothetical protein